MKKIPVDLLMGGEYLAKPITVNNNQILYYEGTCLYMKHIETLFEYGIKEVEIFEESALTPLEKQIVRKKIHKEVTGKVKNILDSHINQNQSSLEYIEETANEIIDDIFSREEVVDRVYDIRERSGDLYDHSVTVAALSVMMAIKLDLSKWEVTEIGMGSLLHDMGLRYLTLNYTDRDLDELSADEYFEYKKHTLYGFSSVEKEGWMCNEVRNIILFHHERIDSSGYPFKQRATTYPVRIVAIADAFDDILCGIGCKKRNVRDAIEHLKSNRDVKFDGRLVDVFLDFIAVYPVGTLVITNNGDEAVVLKQNEHYTDRPVIRLIQDKFGRTYDGEIIINLVENMSTYIEDVKN